ncbi:RNA methyltransferase [Marinicauda salina]|uniref:RNA methyltransferase n=1 Tax=Marinicauda salina TaxID=2135793 RepID=A0A2U2BY14_9PROT|nr:RNA methyltransferase [Marinicauda salina]
MGAGANAVETHRSETGIAKQLGAIDWAFPQRGKGEAIEAVHPYPAKFVSDLPQAVLSVLPVPDETVVLDPFCGSGTALVECQNAGYKSVGIDLNPIACMISRVKTSPAPEGLADHAHLIASSESDACTDDVPIIPNLNHWFKPHIQRTITRILSGISQAPPATQDALKLALSSIIVRVSNQESDTRYAAIEKDVTEQKVLELFTRSAQRIQSALAHQPDPLPECHVFEADTLAFDLTKLSRPVGLVITSPPYPNAYEYWLYHKYRMWWLGHDPINVKAKEIGARAHFFKKNRHTREHFVGQMAKTFELISKVLVPGGYAVFVVGRSKIHGEIVENAEIIVDAAAQFGIEKIFSVERSIAANRKSFNLSHANIKTESIIVLQNRSHEN